MAQKKLKTTAHCLTWSLGAGFCMLQVQPADALTLVRDGVAQASIVIAKTALAPAKDDAVGQKVAIAAQDLQAYLVKISGAKLPIVGDDQPVKGVLVLVGKSRLTAAQKTNIPDGLTPQKREEGFVELSQRGASGSGGQRHGAVSWHGIRRV